MVEYGMEGCILTCIYIMSVPLHPLDVSKLDYTRFIHNDNEHNITPKLVGNTKMSQTTFLSTCTSLALKSGCTMH